MEVIKKKLSDSKKGGKKSSFKTHSDAQYKNTRRKKIFFYARMCGLSRIKLSYAYFKKM